METEPTRMCALLVGLPYVVVVGVGEWPRWLRVVIATNADRPACGCGSRAKRVAFGMRNFRHSRIRSLLYAGRPTWTLLDGLIPP